MSAKQVCVLCGKTLYKLKRHLLEVHHISKEECEDINAKHAANVHYEIDLVGRATYNQVVYTRSKNKTQTLGKGEIEKSRKVYFKGKRTTFVPVKKSFPYADVFCENLAATVKKRRVKEMMSFLEKFWLTSNNRFSIVSSPTAFISAFLKYARKHNLAPSSARRYAWYLIKYLNTVSDVESDTRTKYRIKLTIAKTKQLCADYQKMVTKDNFTKNIEICEYC